MAIRSSQSPTTTVMMIMMMIYCLLGIVGSSGISPEIVLNNVYFEQALTTGTFLMSLGGWRSVWSNNSRKRWDGITGCWGGRAAARNDVSRLRAQLMRLDAPCNRCSWFRPLIYLSIPWLINLVTDDTFSGSLAAMTSRPSLGLAAAAGSFILVIYLCFALWLFCPDIIFVIV